MGSTGETEVASLYYNCKNAVVLRRALNEMGHPQPKTTVVTVNSTAEGLINKTMTRTACLNPVKSQTRY